MIYQFTIKSTFSYTYVYSLSYLPHTRKLYFFLGSINLSSVSSVSRSSLQKISLIFYLNFSLGLKQLYSALSEWYVRIYLWCRGVVAITIVQLHSTKSEFIFCVSSNSARSVSEICNVEILWPWSWLDIKRKHPLSVIHSAKTIHQHQKITNIKLLVLTYGTSKCNHRE